MCSATSEKIMLSLIYFYITCIFPKLLEYFHAKFPMISIEIASVVKKNLSKIPFNIYNSTYYNFNKSPLTLLASRRTGTDSNESLIITRVELIEVQFLTAFPHVTFLVNNLKHWLTIGLWMNPFGQVIIFVS